MANLLKNYHSDVDDVMMDIATVIMCDSIEHAKHNIDVCTKNPTAKNISDVWQALEFFKSDFAKTISPIDCDIIIEKLTTCRI